MPPGRTGARGHNKEIRMLLSAKIWKSEDSEFWLAECQALCVVTQGESQEDAREMLDDAIRTVLPELDFKALWLNKDSGSLVIDASDVRQGLSAILERNRSKDDLTYAEVAERIGNDSANSVFAYEKGKRTASIEMLDRLLSAFGKRLVISVEESA